MFGTILGEATGLLDKRFLLNAFFPVLVATCLLLAVVLGVQHPLTSVVSAWDKEPVTIQALQIIGLLAWVTFAASIVAALPNVLLGLYEGYWPTPLGAALRAMGSRWYRLRMERIAAEEKDSGEGDSQRFSQVFPPSSFPPYSRRGEVMPTRLGNILKSSELYPNMRYNIDTVLVWPRLYDLLPDGYLGVFTGARSALDLMLVVSVLSAIFALVTGVYLLIVAFTVGVTWWLFPLCFGGGMLVAWLAYYGALAPAGTYAQQIRAAFDLYRGLLLKQLKLIEPKNAQEERDEWASVCNFFKGAPNIEARYWKANTPPPPANASSPPPQTPASLTAVLLALLHAPRAIPAPQTATPPADDIPAPTVVGETAVPDVEPGQQAGATPLPARASPGGPLRVGEVLTLLTAALAALGTAVMLWHTTTDTVGVTALKHDVRPYQLITRHDVSRKNVNAHDAGGKIRTREQIVGHYTLRSLAAETPIPTSSIGPHVAPSALGGTVPVRVGVAATSDLPGLLRPGDRVTVTASQGKATKKPFVLHHVLLLASRPHSHVVLAVPRKKATTFEASLRGVNAFISREP